MKQRPPLFNTPFSTRAGCECVAVSRRAMHQGLHHFDEGGSRVLPFVRLFCGTPSSFLWEDDAGTVHHVRQGEGGEQGDALMPLLFSLDQHRALLRSHEIDGFLRQRVHGITARESWQCVCCPPRGTWGKDQGVDSREQGIKVLGLVGHHHFITTTPSRGRRTGATSWEVVESVRGLTSEMAFEPPSWRQLMAGERPPPREPDESTFRVAT